MIPDEDKQAIHDDIKRALRADRRVELLAFARWLLAGEGHWGKAEDHVDKYLAENP